MRSLLLAILAGTCGGEERNDDCTKTNYGTLADATDSNSSANGSKNEYGTMEVVDLELSVSESSGALLFVSLEGAYGTVVPDLYEVTDLNVWTEFHDGEWVYYGARAGSSSIRSAPRASLGMSRPSAFMAISTRTAHTSNGPTGAATEKPSRRALQNVTSMKLRKLAQ